jgi:hypothetical protein
MYAATTASTNAGMRIAHSGRAAPLANVAAPARI